MKKFIFNLGVMVGSAAVILTIGNYTFPITSELKAFSLAFAASIAVLVSFFNIVDMVFKSKKS